ncbi:MAG TPA: methyltransferase domain-containing protein [Actinomycetota bacterium]|jgi:SAM-dependent methyltransferase|nr:methyltransferase domain-containing protein [Actinomycetota bacterium]
MSAEISSAEAGKVWEDSSAGWIRNADLIDRMSEPLRHWVADSVDPQPGMTMLELACGAGDTGFEVAQRLGENGKLIATDISPSMIEGAKQRAKDRGVTNVEFRVMDAQAIDLPDASVDGVFHRYGPMLLPDPDASFAGVRRVLRPGRPYVTVVWASPDRNPWILLTGMTLVQIGLQPPGDPFGPGGMFSLSDPEVIRAKLTAAGFTDVEVEHRDNPFVFADFDEFWRIPTEIAGPIAVILAGLEPDQLEAYKKAFREGAEQFRSGDEYRPQAHSVCVVAR